MAKIPKGGQHHQRKASLSKTGWECLEEERAGRGGRVGEDQPDAVAATLPCGICFQHLKSPECLKAKRVFPPKSDRRDSPEGSSNATTNEETEPGP